MVTLSAGNLVSLRTEQGRATPFLSILQPVTLLTALVNNASIARGARTIAYDNGTGSGFATIAEGQTIEVVTAGGIKKTLVKSISGSQASGTIELYENGILFADNQVLRIKHLYEPHPIPPAIRSGVFYKFYSTTYSNQNSQPAPVAIIGSHRAGFLSAGSIAFSLNSSSSYAIANGASISSRVWSCLHVGGAATGISFSSTTAANPTLTITEAGTYWLKCVVTDSNSQTATTYRALFVYDRGVTDPYKDFTIQSFSGDWQSGGWRVSLQATGDVELSDFPDGSLAVLWYENTFNAVSGYVNLWAVSNEILTCGYLRQDNSQDNFSEGTGSTTFQITTIDDLLNNVAPLGSVSIGAVTSPSKWYEYASWMTTGRSIHHLLLWHAWGVFQCADVFGLTTNTLGVKNTDYTEGSLLQQVNGFAHDRGIFAKLICDRLGRLYLVADSQMLADAGRAALDTVFTITEADISGGVDVARAPEETTTFTQLDGFSFNGTTSTPFISIVPGYRESSISYIMPEERGGSTAAVSNQVLADQTDSNVRVGRYHAVQNNNPRELRFSNPYNGLGAFDIVCSIGWYNWGIADADLKRNTELFGKLFVCRHIDVRFNHQAGTILTDVVLEREAIGPPGIQGNYPTGYPATSNNPTEPDWDEDGAIVSTQFGIVWNSNEPDTSGQSIFGQVGSISYGAAYTFNSVFVNYIAACGLSATQALIVYRVHSNSDMTARIVNLTGKEVTSAGAELLLIADARVGPSVIKLTSTKALAIWDDGTDVYGVILTVSGSTLSAGTITDLTLDTTGGAYAHIARLSDTLAIAVCHQDKDVGKPQAVPLAISGTTITPGTPADATANFNGDLGNVEIAPLDATTAIVFYRARDTTLVLRASLLYSITGSGFTLGGDVLIDDDGNGPDEPVESPRWAMALDSSRAIVTYSSDTGAKFLLRAAVVEKSGTTLAAGTPVTLYTPPDVIPPLDTGFRRPSVAALSSSKALVAFYGDAQTAVVAGTAVSVNISGTVVTDNGDDTDFSSAVDNSAFNVAPCALVLD